MRRSASGTSRSSANLARDSAKISSRRACWLASSFSSATSFWRRACASPPPPPPPPGPAAGPGAGSSFAAAAPAGRQRSAALGTRSTFSRLSATMRTFAVMPGTSSRLGFGVSTTTVYVTTFCTVCAALRIWRTRPSNVRPAKASTVNVTFWSCRMRPMSDSSIATSTCMSRRSFAIVKSVGVLRLAATVCPASTWREMTTPSTGAVIAVLLRSLRAAASAASRCFTTAAALATCASADFTCASAVRMASAAALSVNLALSRSAPEMKPLATSDCLRSRSRFASSQVIFARSSCDRCAAASLCFWIADVRAASTSASACRTRIS